MIILFPKKINTFNVFLSNYVTFSEFLSNYKNLVNLPHINCPYCNSSDVIKWGFYQRSVCFIDKDNISYNIIDIQRVKCKNCNCTHALLPSFIVPYKQHALDIILYSISNDDISYNCEISFDTVINWKHQFNMFLPFLKTMFDNISKFDIIDKLKSNIFYYYHLFFIKNNSLLMMIRSKIFGTCYF